MAGHKRFLVAVVVVAGLAAATLGLAAPVSAAPYVQAPTLSVSTTAPCESTSITVTGTDFVPGSTVSLTLAGVASLGSVVVNSSGGFTTIIELPEVVGTFQLVASGPATATNSNTARATLNILNCAVAPVVPVTG